LPTDEQLRASAREILSGSEFARWEREQQTGQALLERLIEAAPVWLIDLLAWLQEMLQAIPSALARGLGLFGVFGEAAEGVGWTALCLLLAASIVILWRWRERSRRSEGRGGEGRASSTVRHAEALAAARARAREGRFLEAAHGVQMAILAWLIDRDWLELARSDPNRTLRRRIATSGLPEREARDLIALVDRLEALWFDDPRLDAPREDPALFEAWLSLDARIVSLAGGRR